MKEKLSMLKMRIYCYVVNQNIYVRDAYQLPVDLDMEYHRKHRIKELFRLVKLLWKYRILHRKPSEEEAADLKEMQERKMQMLDAQAEMFAVQTDEAQLIREAVTDAIDEIKGADLVRFSGREKVIIWGNGFGSDIPQLVKKLTGSFDRSGREYQFIWLRNKKKQGEISTVATFYYPGVLMIESGYPESKSLSLTDDESRMLARYAFLRHCADGILSECPQMDDTYAKLISHEIYRYFSAVLEYLKPQLVYVWNESAWFSLISKTCCDDSDIPFEILDSDCFPHSVHTDADIMSVMQAGRGERHNVY